MRGSREFVMDISRGGLKLNGLRKRNVTFVGDGLPDVPDTERKSKNYA